LWLLTTGLPSLLRCPRKIGCLDLGLDLGKTGCLDLGLKLLGRLAGIELMLTALTGWIFYWLAFVA
jgi:hypothetical protein